MLRLYNPRPRIVSNWLTGVIAAYSIGVLTLVGLAMSTPKIPVWLAEATQAQSVAPDAEPSPSTVIAQPAAIGVTLAGDYHR